MGNSGKYRLWLVDEGHEGNAAPVDAQQLSSPLVPRHGIDGPGHAARLDWLAI